MEMVKVKEEVKAEYEYRAFDGTVFEDVDECLEYEREKKKEIHSDMFSFVHIPDYIGEVMIVKIINKADFEQKLLIINDMYPGLGFTGSDMNDSRYRGYCLNKYNSKYDGQYVVFEYFREENCYYDSLSCYLASELYKDIEAEIAERNKTLTELIDVISK